MEVNRFKKAAAVPSRETCWLISNTDMLPLFESTGPVVYLPFDLLDPELLENGELGTAKERLCLLIILFKLRFIVSP